GTSGNGSGRDSQQLRFLGRLESAADNPIAVAEGHFARGHPAQVASNAVVNLVTEQQIPQDLMAADRPKINILQENFVEVTLDIPPVPGLSARHDLREKILTFMDG